MRLLPTLPFSCLAISQIDRVNREAVGRFRWLTPALRQDQFKVNLFFPRLLRLSSLAKKHRTTSRYAAGGGSASNRADVGRSSQPTPDRPLILPPGPERELVHIDTWTKAHRPRPVPDFPPLLTRPLRNRASHVRPPGPTSGRHVPLQKQGPNRPDQRTRKQEKPRSRLQKKKRPRPAGPPRYPRGQTWSLPPRVADPAHAGRPAHRVRLLASPMRCCPWCLAFGGPSPRFA